MFAPSPASRTWTIEELQDRLLHAFLPENWTPFAMPSDAPNYRSICLMDAKPLGIGAFGIVFTVALSVPKSATNGELRYVPAAMKVSLSGYEHCNDIVSGLAMNDLLMSGMTPGVTRTIDGFSVSARKKICSMPPTSWELFWDKMVTFLERVWSTARIGELFNPRPSRVSEGLDAIRERGTLCFLFTELGAESLRENAESIYDFQVNIPTSSPNFLRQSVAAARDTAKRSRGILVDCYQRIQAIQAFHAAGCLHGDIHCHNFVVNHSGEFRTNYCRLANAIFDASSLHYFGRSGEDRPDDLFYGDHKNAGWRFYALPMNSYHSTPRDGQSTQCIALGPHDPIVTLIDYGTMLRMNAPTGTNPHNIRHQWQDSTGPLPKYIISSNPPSYNNQLYFPDSNTSSSSGTAPLPGMSIVSQPTTIVYTRAPEMLNPPFTDKLYRYRPYSELSDVFSMASCLVAQILGYYPFANHILLNTNNDINSLGVFAEKHRRENIFYLAEDRCRTKIDEFVLNPRYEAKHPPSFSYVHVDGDLWAYPDPTVVSEMGSYFRNIMQDSSDHQSAAYIRAWLGSDRALLDNCSSMLCRVLALGPPSRQLFQGTIFENLFLKYRIFERTGSGWLRTVLQRVLVTHYGLERRHVTDFVNLIMDALSWDPAHRPPASEFLRCAIFSPLYVDASEYGLRLCDLWSVELPTVNTWPYENGVAIPPNQRPINNELIVKDRCLPWSVRMEEACRATARIQQRNKDHCALPGFHTRRSSKNLYISPYQSYLVYYFNFVTGGFDMYNVSPLRLTTGDSPESYTAAHMRGRFRTLKNIEDHRRNLDQYSTRMPFWLIDVSGLETTTSSSKRPREESFQSEESPKKRQKR